MNGARRLATVSAMIGFAVAGGCSPVIVRDSPLACAFEREATLPTTIADGLPIVEATINGRPLRLIFDTGSNATALFDEAAEKLGAPTDWSRMSVVTGLNGTRIHFNIALSEFVLGGVAIDQKAIGVGSISAQIQKIADGVLGTDVLSRFDVDFDLPHQRIDLYRWRNCPGGPAPENLTWRTLSLEPATHKTGRPIVSGTLDGAKVLVMINSGAAGMVVRRDTAVRAGVTPATLATDHDTDLYGIGPNAMTGEIHRFARFTLGSISLRNVLGIVSDPGPPDVDVLYGAQMLRATRVWLSLAGDRLYVGAPPPPRAVARGATPVPSPAAAR